jgi:magnesium transporter
MIIVHTAPPGGEGRFERQLLRPGEALPQHSVWIDLMEPTRDDDHLVERHLGIEVPTREDMNDIAPSEILYSYSNAYYMTARLLCGSDLDQPYIAGVTFILTKEALVTVRYDEAHAFANFEQRISRPQACATTPAGVLAGLIDTIGDRAAEVLQKIGDHVDQLSHRIFDDAAGNKAARHQATLKALGKAGDVVSHIRESLVSIERMLLFISGDGHESHQNNGSLLQSQARTTLRDQQSLEEHASFISGKIQFLLDAILGLVNLEQNNIIKLFSVISVVLMPPTLIASIYGMNFKIIPELQFDYGYELALCGMLISAVVPYTFFKWRGWF